MKVTLFMAISINGFVTGRNDDTEWVKDTEILYKIISEKGACVMGKRTYLEADKYSAFPYKQAINIVLTHDQKLMDKSTEETVFTSAAPGEVVTMLENKGYKELIVVGGGTINSEFLAAGLIDEIIIDVHPIIIDQGIKLFEKDFPRKDLEMVGSKILESGMVQIKYTVKK